VESCPAGAMSSDDLDSIEPPLDLPAPLLNDIADIQKAAEAGDDEVETQAGNEDQGLRYRGGAKHEQREASDEDYELFMPNQRRGYRTCFICLIATAALLGAVSAALWVGYTNPSPLDCSVDQMHASRFKIEVTDLWMPRLSSTLQLVLSVRNRNLLRSMMLEACRVHVLEEATGLKLGASSHGTMFVPPMRSLQLNLAIKEFGGSLPPPEQRRLAELFLRHKALLLTIVATATSKIPLKTAKTAEHTTNSSRRLELAALAKDPFYTRPPPPPKVDPDDSMHDVPL